MSELRYKPYGETRYSGLPNGTGTDYRFSGQRQLAGLGLCPMGNDVLLGGDGLADLALGAVALALAAE